MPAFLQTAIAEHVATLNLGKADVLCRTQRGTLFRQDYFNRNI